MFILLPVGMNYRTERLPIVTFALIGLNTLVYLVSLICHFGTGAASDPWIYGHLWLIPVDSILWTYLTSMFVHAGFFHLFGNMIFLFLFGCCVEDIIGRGRFLVFYLAGGLVAELAYIALTPLHFASEIPMGGASGAISTCMGIYLLLRANADIEFKYFYWGGDGDFSLPAWVAISFWFLKDLFWTVFGLFYQHTGGGVAFGAHVGGFLAGLALAGLHHWLGRQRAEPAAEAVAAPLPTAVVESPDETPAIYLHDGGVQSGPFNLVQIQQMFSLGSISRDALYWSEGMTDWVSVLELSYRPSG